MKRLVLIASLLLALSSCGEMNSEAIRHLVIAELIQQEKVPESQVEITSVRFASEDQAIVEARILDLATKGSAPQRQVTCRLQRREGRWHLAAVSREP